MDRVVIVGSGASGVHFALTILKKGYEVLMLDVGNQGPEPAYAGDGFNELKARLRDPVNYFLGADFEGVLYPDSKSEYYGIPPSKNHIFAGVDGFKVTTNGFSPLWSFARGGLAEAWTGGVYPFNDEELKRFPISYRDLEPYYNQVAERIGIAGVSDDLGKFMPVHENLLPPLKLDPHSALLLAEYERSKHFLNTKLGCYMGRARVATLSQASNGRGACSYLGRCLWGCPVAAFYTPSLTLDACKRLPNFSYLSGRYVDHFRFHSTGRITSVVTKSFPEGKWEEFALDKLVLAGGTLSSSRIFLTSIFKQTGEVVKLRGLMDNRQILVPFVNLKMIGKPYDPLSYQYHQVAMGFVEETAQDYIHALITTLKTALVHPIVQAIPFDLKTSLLLFRNVHAALGLVNVNFHDTRRDCNTVTLEPASDSSNTSLLINYCPRPDEQSLIRRTVKRLTRALRKLHCIVPPGMVRVRPMGASVHYAGTIPMSARKSLLTASELCQSHDFENLFVVDGTTFPSLPAKNITFTLMANAVRVADRAF